jgi:hypothetical protein
MILFTALGFWACLRATQGSWKSAAVWGLSGFAALTIKQPSGVDFAGMSIGLILLATLGSISWKKITTMLAIGILSGAVPLGILLLGFHLYDSLHELVYICFTYGFTAYSAVESHHLRLFNNWLFLVKEQPFLFGYGSVSCLILLCMTVAKRKLRDVNAQNLVILFCWTIATLYGTALGKSASPHYYLQMMPPLAIGAGILLNQLAQISSSATLPAFDRRRRLARAFTCVCVLQLLLTAPDFNRVASTTHRLPDEIQRFSEIIFRNTNENERVLVWGYAPEIYVAARRLPACADFTAQFASGWVPGRRSDEFKQRIVPWIRRQFLEDLNRHEPAFVVDYSHAGFLPLTTFAELQNEIQEKYVLVDQCKTAWWFDSGTVRLLKRRDDVLDKRVLNHTRETWIKQDHVVI